jgi:hypothetical protein
MTDSQTTKGSASAFDKLLAGSGLIIGWVCGFVTGWCLHAY